MHTIYIGKQRMSFFLSIRYLSCYFFDAFLSHNFSVKSRNPFLANVEWRGILQYSRVKTVQMGASAKGP